MSISVLQTAIVVVVAAAAHLNGQQTNKLDTTLKAGCSLEALRGLFAVFVLHEDDN